MDTLEYLSASGEFAIMRKGTPSHGSVEKELEGLLDMRPESAGFAEKQLRPFLENYGRHFASAQNKDLVITGDGEDEERLSRLGYYIRRSGRRGEASLCLDRVAVASDTYKVSLASPYSSPCLKNEREALRYVAELGLVSQGFESKEVVLKPVINTEGDEATYTLAPPETLLLDIQETQAGGYAPLEGTLVAGFDQTQRDFGFLETKLDESRRRSWSLEIDLSVTLGGTNSERRDLVATQPNESPIVRSLNMLSAGLLLSLIAERYHLRPRSFVVDPTTLKLKPNETPYLMGELVRCIALGKVHPCAHCGRPLMGGTWYCRGRRCKASDLEKARLLATSGRGVDEILAIYPHIKPTTIEGYVEDARRGLL